MVLYNLIFSASLLGLLGAYLLLQQHFVASIERLSTAVQLWSTRLVKYGSIGLGAVLLLNATWFFGAP